MDLSKVKPEPIKDDPLNKSYKNDQLGALKIRRRWISMRDEVVKALMAAEKKIKRAKKLKKSVREIFNMIQSIKKKKEPKKISNDLRTFFNMITDKTYEKFNLNALSQENLEWIRDFIEYVRPILVKNNPDIKEILDDWKDTLDELINNYPTNFDDYAKEIVREIVDALFDFTEKAEAQHEIENIELATSPFFNSEIEIAAIGNEGDYENM